jgi:hypothetical protein
MSSNPRPPHDNTEVPRGSWALSSHRGNGRELRLPGTPSDVRVVSGISVRDCRESG